MPQHGDFRLENLFFSTGTDECAFIDFQLVAIGNVVTDPMYFLMNSVPVEWRRENELALLNAFYDALLGAGKADPAVYVSGLCQAQVDTLRWIQVTPCRICCDT